MSATDRDLVTQSQRGDNAAFGEVWARHERSIVAFCRQYLIGPGTDPAEDAEDIARETFVRALHGLASYVDRTDAGARFENWLMEIAKRLCYKHLAKQRRRYTLLCGWLEESGRTTLDTDTLRAVEDKDALRIAVQEINALPERYRSAFRLFLEERSQKEIAEMLGISVENASKRIQRARRLLRPRLAGLFGIRQKTAPRNRLQHANAVLRSVEKTLGELVGEHRIVRFTLPSGGEIQLCVRIDPGWKSAREMDVPDQPSYTCTGRLGNLLDAADQYYYRGQWRDAREEYREILRLDARNWPAVIRLGEILTQQGSKADAASVYRAALHENPPQHIASQIHACLLMAEGRIEDSVEQFRYAIDA